MAPLILFSISAVPASKHGNWAWVWWWKTLLWRDFEILLLQIIFHAVWSLYMIHFVKTILAY